MFFSNRQLVKIQQIYKLSNRELQVVKLLSQGIDSNAEIAHKLSISEHASSFI
jgi:DNA-binding CsgD family transcriptional regulator